MTQEDKELLLKDLCARMPYEVKVKFYDHWVDEYEIIPLTAKLLADTVYIGDIKPYLFPMSSMTEEQTDSWRDYWFPDLITSTKVNYPESKKYLALSHSKSIEWLYKHHFDVNGLIPKGLANDAPGKNIY